jgi:hypothetical protein
MRTLLAFYTITNILKDMINDYRVVNNTRVTREIEEKEKGHEVEENVTEINTEINNENITEIMGKTHDLMDKTPLTNWLDYAIDAVLHLSDSGISLQLISASILSYNDGICG